jgi:hypothetical protein
MLLHTHTHSLSLSLSLSTLSLSEHVRVMCLFPMHEGTSYKISCILKSYRNLQYSLFLNICDFSFTRYKCIYTIKYFFLIRRQRSSLCIRR